jgi:hypothetical protein
MNGSEIEAVMSEHFSDEFLSRTLRAVFEAHNVAHEEVHAQFQRQGGGQRVALLPSRQVGGLLARHGIAVRAERCRSEVARFRLVAYGGS